MVPWGYARVHLRRCVSQKLVLSTDVVFRVLVSGSLIAWYVTVYPAGLITSFPAL